MALDSLPLALLHTIVSKLDLQSICAASATCRTLHTCCSLILPQLDSIYLVDTPLRGSELEKYIACNSKIQSLTLNCRKLEDGDVCLFVKPHLQKLSLLRCCRFSGKVFIEIGLHCTNLRSLSLELISIIEPGAFGTTKHVLEVMLKSLPQLEFLSISVDDDNARLFGEIHECVGPSLKALAAGHITEHYVKRLLNATWTGITALSPGIRVVGCQNLQQLCLVLDVITDVLMSLLTNNLASLCHLDLEDDPLEVPPTVLDLSNFGIQQISACRKLRRLSLVRRCSIGRDEHHPVSFRRVNDLGFLLLAQSCKGLESIRLGGFSQVSDTGLNSLLNNSLNLRTFELIHMNRISDLTFHDMGATPLTLVAVSLPGAKQITGEAVEQLACCEHVKFLNLALCRSVGDNGLKAVSALRKLTILDLNGADITDFGLFALAKSSSPLKSLSLRGCKRLTSTGIIALVQGPLSMTLQALDLSCLPTVTDSTVLALISSGMQIVDLRLRDCHALTEGCISALAHMQYLEHHHGGSLKALDLWNNPGITAGSLWWFKKPFFPRLRWLGLGKHLISDQASSSIVQERCFVDVSWEGWDPDFGFNKLCAEHQNANGGLGFWL